MAQPHRVSSTRRSGESGGNGTTDAVDGLASQSQNPARSSVAVEAGQDTERATSGGPNPDSVVPDEVPKISGQATERATSGGPNPDSEGLGGLNEGSEKALVVQLHGALHGLEELDRAAGVFHAVTRTCIAVLLRCVRSLDYNLHQKLCEHILPNGEKAGQSSSKGNLAENSDAPDAKRKKPSGVRQRHKSFVSEIRVRGKKNKVWLGTYKTEEEAAQAFQAAADLRKAHPDSKSFNKELDALKKRAEKAGEPLSDDRSHHNVASSDLVGNLEEKATTSASPEGKAVSQCESPPHENFFPEFVLDNHSPEFVLDNHSPELNLDNHSPELNLDNHSPELNLDNHSPKLNWDNCFRF